jgi:glycosyltransferase involved in cell wall biosynthesis
MANLNIASCLEDILEALTLIKDENVILLVAGSGPMYGYYRNLAAKCALKARAVFLGHLDRKQAVNYIIAADLCLVYYRNREVNKYRASMKLREYLALSKNIVADDVGEIRVFRRFVYLSKPSIRAYAAEIKKRIKTLDKRAIKGYKEIQKNYNYSIEIRGFYKFLKELLKG